MDGSAYNVEKPLLTTSLNHKRNSVRRPSEKPKFSYKEIRDNDYLDESSRQMQAPFYVPLLFLNHHMDESSTTCKHPSR
jgi:hypothetical protein